MMDKRKNISRSAVGNDNALTPYLSIVREFVESPIHNNCYTEMRNLEENQSSHSADKDILSQLQNILNNEDIVENYFILQDKLKSNKNQLNDEKEEFKSIEEEYADKIKNSSKYCEDQLGILKQSNTEKSLYIQKQLELEKTQFDETEKQLQVDLEMLEEATSFRQEIMETELTKSLVELTTLINQMKSTNNALQDQIQSLQTNANNNLNLPEITSMITPEMVLQDLPEYHGHQIFNTININVHQPSNSAMTSTASVDVNLKRVTAAPIPGKSSVTTSKYMPLPMIVSENESRTTACKKPKKKECNRKKNNQHNIDITQSCPDASKDIEPRIEPSSGKKRKLYNPDADFEYLKLLGEEYKD